MLKGKSKSYKGGTTVMFKEISLLCVALNKIHTLNNRANPLLYNTPGSKGKNFSLIKLHKIPNS